MGFTAINPATGRTIGHYDEMNRQEVEAAIAAADGAFRSWRRASFAERAKPMLKAAEILERDAPRLARLMAEEMGKPIREGAAEVKKCATACRYYAETADALLAPQPVALEGARAFVTFRPLGVVLAVMPWNFPFWQVFRFAAPGLMAGNAAVLKHASNVPGCALAIEQVFRDAGFPPDLFRTLMIGSRAVEAVIENPRIRAVTLTGSGPAGRAVASKAGALLKKTVLELGGSDPYLVLADADMTLAAEVATKGRLVNSGQSCIAAKRFIVVESVKAAFEDAFTARMRRVKMGDPLDGASELGPQARADLRDGLHDQVRRSLAKGARCLLGGEIPPGSGAFYPPTILTDVTPGMAAFDEEVFGPIAAIVPARDEAEAIDLANRSPFGLGGGVITGDLAKGERIAVDGIDSGSVFVNEPVRSDPRLPFGGVRDSGYGRELADYGIKEFVNIKTIYIASRHEPSGARPE